MSKWQIVFILCVGVLSVTGLAQDRPVTSAEIAELIKNGVSDDVIIEKIRTSGCRCDRSAAGIMILKGAGASDAVIRAVINSSDGPVRKDQAPTAPRNVADPSGEPTRVTVFGGYSYARSEGDLGGFNWNGFNGSVTGHLNDWFGITGEVSGHYTDFEGLIDVDLYNFAVGPQFSSSGRTGRVRGFGRVMVGAGRLGAGVFGIGDSLTKFSTTVGGGVDVGVTEGFAIRVVQADWLRLWGGSDENGDLLRLSFGVVGRF